MLSVLAYPAPRAPEYLTEPADLAELAVAAAKRTAGRGALGTAGKDERVLLVVPPPPIQDAAVLSALLQALRSNGINVTALPEDEACMIPPRDELLPVSAADGWKEILWRPETTAMFPEDVQRQRPATLSDVGSGDPHQLKLWLDEHPSFDALFAGLGGRPYWRWGIENHGDKFRENWTYLSREDLVSRANTFPGELMQLIEDKTLEWIPEAVEIRITDPQGTDLRFEVTEAEARHWATEAWVPNHLFLNPAVENRSPAKTGDNVPPEHYSLPRANGIIAGTGNHVGYFPHMAFQLEEGLVTRVDGGGQFGEMIRHVLDRTREVQYPHYPRPGYAFLVEIALGTNPKEFRNRAGLFDGYFPMPNLGERKRSGVLHFGIGVHPIHEDVLRFGAEHNLPTQHGWHIHTYLTTYRVRLRSGEWRTILDRGHMTALDDPSVRELAARFGDPNELLAEDWVPAIPGINYPGRYLDDYGQDPAAWIRAEIEGRLPATIGVPGQ